jgi:hypothetical protein
MFLSDYTINIKGMSEFAFLNVMVYEAMVLQESYLIAHKLV